MKFSRGSPLLDLRILAEVKTVATYAPSTLWQSIMVPQPKNGSSSFSLGQSQ